MSMEKGQLSIHTENFLPIIKKWLYSDRDIFIRELISNCCDAVAKRRMVGQIPDDYQPRVTVRVDKEHRILSFTDNGVGMTAEEVRKYINQVAFSGANDFMEKYKDSGEQIIGHFGLGFYSAFMVADKVRIDTLSCLPDAKAVCWESDGSVEYTMEETEREEVGTTVTLYLNNESDEFLDGNTVKSTIRKYCSFMPTPIYCEVAEDEKKHEHDHEDGCECGHDHEHEENCECGHDHEHEHEEEVPEMLNTPNPLYMRAPKDCTDEDYKKFYRDTFHEWDEPLFWIHLNADYPFNLHGILYFPRLKNEITNEGQVKLYSNQVFIADNIKEIIPEDSPYTCDAPNPQTVTISAGQTAEVTFTNRMKPGEIRIQKTDTHGESLAGAEFLLEWSKDGRQWQTVTYTDSPDVTEGTCTAEGLTDGKLTSGADGEVRFTGLYSGSLYRVTETKAPKGYQLLTEHVYEGSIRKDDGNFTRLTVVNAPVFELPMTGSTGYTAMTAIQVGTGIVLLFILIRLAKKRK